MFNTVAFVMCSLVGIVSFCFGNLTQGTLCLSLSLLNYCGMVEYLQEKAR